MDSRSVDYTPPPTSEMLGRQDEIDSLRLLIAQRRLYRRSKRWLALRWFGMLVVGLAAPVVSVVWPNLAVLTGAVAGLWLFLGRTLFVLLQKGTTAKAAATQEQFDFRVFGMPAQVERSSLPPLEEIASIAGPDDKIGTVADKESLYGWYTLQASNSPVVAVAICQRANAAYADAMLRRTAVVWGVGTAIWAVALIAVSLLAQISLLQFFAGVFLPLLPASLDVGAYIGGTWRAARDRADLVRSIEKGLRGSKGPLDPSALLVWQERLYDLRVDTPAVPELLYRRWRKRSEVAMASAARQLGERTREADSG